MDEQLQKILNEEIQPDEQLLFSAQPDADSFVGTLLPYSLLWLSGLFLYSIGAIRDSSGSHGRLLFGLIVLLVLVALSGVFQLVMVPRRAKRTVYAVTTRRVFTLCQHGKYPLRSILTTVDDDMRVLQVRKKDSYFIGIYLPSQLMFAYMFSQVFMHVAQNFEPFVAGGFAFIILAWLYPWYQDLRLPLADFREAPRSLYITHGELVSIDSVLREEIKSIRPRGLKREVGDLFVISKFGCLRLKRFKEVEQVSELLRNQLKEGAV